MFRIGSDSSPVLGRPSVQAIAPHGIQPVNRTPHVRMTTQLSISPRTGKRGRARLERLHAEGRIALAPLSAQRESALREATGGAGGYARAEELRHTPVVGDTVRLFVTLTKGGRAMDPNRRAAMIESVTYTRAVFAEQRRRYSVPLRKP